MEGNQTMRMQPPDRRGPYIGDRSLAEILESCPVPSPRDMRASRVLRARRELDDATFAALQDGYAQAPSLQTFVRNLTESELRVLANLVGDPEGGRS